MLARVDESFPGEREPRHGALAVGQVGLEQSLEQGPPRGGRPHRLKLPPYRPRARVGRVTEPHINDNKTHIPAVAERVFLTFSMIGTVSALAWVLWFSRYGLDFTDESFYLVWMSNPFNYSVSATQFGFIYHPLYELLGGNIAALRQANMLITFGLAWVLCNLFLKTVFGTQALEATHRLVISAALATTSLVFLATWLPTPSYNSLTLQALLVAASGLLLAEKTASRTSIAGWLLIGVGGWLTFMAKPTTAAALGVCAGVYLLLAGKLSVSLLAISLASAIGLLVLSALAIDGSIPGFIDRLKGGAEVGRALGGGHTLAQLLRLDDFQLGEKGRTLLIVGTVVFASAAYFSQAQTRSLVFGAALLSMSFVLLELAIVGGFIQKPLNAGPSQGLLIGAIPFAGIAVGLLLTRLQLLVHVTRAQWALALIFLTFPHIYAFGTNNNYWNVGANAGIFWVLAGVALLGPIASISRLSVLLLPLGLAAQLVTVALILTGIEAPYRQPHPLRENNYPLEIGKPGSMLALSKGFGHYFAEAIDVANQAGFKKGTPMIDLTGQSPGILYAIGASNIGQAWTIGGYPGSKALAAAMLKKVSCEELATAWLLVEPEGPRKIDPDILMSYGASMAADFEVVGTFKTAEGAGGYKEARQQKVLKPVRSSNTAISSCAATRATKP